MISIVRKPENNFINPIFYIGELNPPVYRLNDEKLIQWLRAKVYKLVLHLADSPSYAYSNTVQSFVSRSTSNVKPTAGLLSFFFFFSK